MFYISDIYDEVTTFKVKGLYCYSTSSSYKCCRGSLFCRLEDLKTIKVGVFDSTDGSVEWYYILDLLNLVVRNNISIEGFRYKLKKANPYLDIIYHLKEIVISVTIASTSSEYMRDLAKYKLTGVSISSNGALQSLDASMIKNGVLEIPDVVRTFSPNILISNYNPTVNPITRVILPDCVDFTELSIFFTRYRLAGCTLVVNYDVTLNKKEFSFISRFKLNLIVNGKVYVGSLNKQIEHYKNSYLSGEIITITDNKYKRIVDFSSGTVKKVLK